MTRRAQNENILSHHRKFWELATVLNVVGVQMSCCIADLALSDRFRKPLVKDSFFPRSRISTLPVWVLLFPSKAVATRRGTKASKAVAFGPKRFHLKYAIACFTGHVGSVFWVPGWRRAQSAASRAARFIATNLTSVSLEFCATNRADQVHFWPSGAVRSLFHPVMVFDTDRNSK